MHAALSSYNKAINLDPDNIGYYHLRQSVLEHLKRFNDVLSDYHKIINLMIQEGVADSTIASEISRRARMYYKLGDYKRFYSDAKWASELQPNNDTYRKWQFDGAKKLGNYTEVIQYCNLKLKEHPQSAEFYLERAKANRSLHKIDDANKDFDLATKFSDKEDYDFQVQLFDYNRDCSANAY